MPAKLAVLPRIPVSWLKSVVLPALGFPASATVTGTAARAGRTGRETGLMGRPGSRVQVPLVARTAVVEPQEDMAREPRGDPEARSHDADDHRIARLHHVEPAAQAHAHGLEALDVLMIPVDVADQPALAGVEPVRGNPRDRIRTSAPARPAGEGRGLTARLSSSWKRVRYENHSHSQGAEEARGPFGASVGLDDDDAGLWWARARYRRWARRCESGTARARRVSHTAWGTVCCPVRGWRRAKPPGSRAIFGPCEGENRDVRGSKGRDRAKAFSGDGCRRGRRRGLAPGDRARRGASFARSRDAHASGGSGAGTGASRERRTAGNPVPGVARRHGIAAGAAVEGHRRIPLRTPRDRDRAVAGTGSDGSPGDRFSAGAPAGRTHPRTQDHVRGAHRDLPGPDEAP